MPPVPDCLRSFPVFLKMLNICNAFCILARKSKALYMKKSPIQIKLLALYTCCCLSITSWSQYSIAGNIHAPERQYKEVVLEYLPSIRGLTHLNGHNIINSTPIDSNGYFIMYGSDLPKEKHLYRLSLQNKESGGVGIAVGSYSKNFIHIVLDNTTKLEVRTCDTIIDQPEYFGNCELNGSTESAIIQAFYDELLPDFANDKIQLRHNKSAKKELFIREKRNSILMHYCDTSQHLIPSMLAFAHIEQWEKILKEQPAFFERYKQQILKEAPNLPYVIELKNEIETQQEILHGRNRDYRNLIITLLAGVVLLLSGYVFFLKKRLKQISTPKTEDVKPKISSLSKKELEVFQHILAGKSNKEIATLLFVEVTTVKSHIGNIYQKLDVKSREAAIKVGRNT